MFSSLTFLFPSYPFDVKSIDGTYAPEAEMIQILYPEAKILLIDIEQLTEQGMKTSKNLSTLDGETTVIYRGWMLTKEQYTHMEKHFSNEGITLLTNTEEYIHSHYLPNWYPHLKEFTMDTVFAQSINDIPQVMKENNLNGAFVKDCVKSLTTSEGSIANSPEQAVKIAQEILSTRGKIEGDTICLRTIVNLLPHTEERYFVLNGNAFGRTGKVTSIVEKISKLHTAPFYSVDTVCLDSGKEILIEIGDGQVSDIKKWSVSNFYKIFS